MLGGVHQSHDGRLGKSKTITKGEQRGSPHRQGGNLFSTLSKLTHPVLPTARGSSRSWPVGNLGCPELAGFIDGTDSIVGPNRRKHEGIYMD